MIDVEVGGTVAVTGGGSATLVRVDVFSGNLQVDGHTTAVVVGNIARGARAADNGNLVVDNNAAAVVRSNLVVGDLTCAGNTSLDEFFNRVYGDDNCIPAAVAQ